MYVFDLYIICFCILHCVYKNVYSLTLMLMHLYKINALYIHPSLLSFIQKAKNIKHS
jgi:hypothetical protein